MRLKMKLKPFAPLVARPKHWVAELNEILAEHNHRHAVKDKDVSYKTQEDRRKFLFAFFRELRHNEEKVYKPMPSNLGNTHVKFIVGRWVRRGMAPGTIQLYLSYLRTFCEWIGKPGMILPAEAYVDDPALVARHYAACKDKSWSAHGVIPAEKIAEVKAFDPWVGTQLELQLRFGLRRKEPIMCRPHLAEVPASALPAAEWDPDLPPDVTYLEVEQGTKGGRLRHVPIDTPEKRAASEEAKRVVTVKGAHLGRPGKSLAQNMRRYDHLMGKFGITQEMIGVTGHGLRHEYGNDRYEKYSGEPSPVRGGGKIDRERDKAARLKVVKELGHARESIGRAYLGPILKGKPATASPEASPPAQEELGADAPAPDAEGGE
jgi:integrase